VSFLDIPKVGTKLPILGILLNSMSLVTSKRAKTESLADALFTATQQRVLGALFGQPDRSFFVTQLMGLAGSGRGAVQRELERLQKSGLVTVQMIGTQKHFQANPESPLFNELRSIIQKTVGLAGPIREALELLEGNIHLALVFGSVAKRTDTSSSDIDLLIVADDVRLEDAYKILMPVEEALARRISTKLYMLAEFRERRDSGNAFIQRILAGPVIELIGTVDGI